MPWRGPASVYRRDVEMERRQEAREIAGDGHLTHSRNLARRASIGAGNVRTGRPICDNGGERYDHIFANHPDLRVVDRPRYLYDDAVEAGSDHALVIAELEVRVARGKNFPGRTDPAVFMEETRRIGDQN